MTVFNKKHIPIIISLFLSLSLILFSIPVLANDGDIRLAGQPVFSITSAADSGSIAKRAETIQNNLDNALVAAQDHTPSSVNITYVKGTPVITLGGYQVVTVGIKDATAAHITPALLASQWADAVRNSLKDQTSVNSYIAQLSGTYASSAPAAAPVNRASNRPAPNNVSAYANNSPSSSNYGYASGRPAAGTYRTPQNADSYNNNSDASMPYSSSQPAQGYRQGRIVYAPAGQIIPITLTTAIATQVAKAGDFIMATISQNVTIGDSIIPAGTQVVGQVASASAGGRFTRSGELQIKFTSLRLPDGSQAPITAHIVGNVGKYAKGKQEDQLEGETWKNKVGSVAFRGLIGAGGGAALGTAVGAIAGGGHGAGMGAWSGAAIGTGVGAADSLILRKGENVTIPSGTNIQIQLDSPVSIAGAPPNNYNQGSYNPGEYGGPAYNNGGVGTGYGASYPNGAPAYNGGYNTNPYNPPPVR